MVGLIKHLKNQIAQKYWIISIRLFFEKILSVFNKKILLKIVRKYKWYNTKRYCYQLMESFNKLNSDKKMNKLLLDLKRLFIKQFTDIVLYCYFSLNIVRSVSLVLLIFFGNQVSNCLCSIIISHTLEWHFLLLKAESVWLTQRGL